MNAEAPQSAATPQTEISATALSEEELRDFTIKLVSALKTVYDPEIPVDIYELGLIYKVDVADNKDTVVDMTLTAPGCPVAGISPATGHAGAVSVMSTVTFLFASSTSTL